MSEKIECKEDCEYRILVHQIECCGASKNELPYQAKKAAITTDDDIRYLICTWNYKVLQKTG